MTEASSGNFHICTTAQSWLISMYGFTISSLHILIALPSSLPHYGSVCTQGMSERRLCACPQRLDVLTFCPLFSKFLQSCSRAAWRLCLILWGSLIHNTKTSRDQRQSHRLDCHSLSLPVTCWITHQQPQPGLFFFLIFYLQFKI